MEHLHTVTDRDSRFIIDTNTGEIQNLTKTLSPNFLYSM